MSAERVAGNYALRFLQKGAYMSAELFATARVTLTIEVAAASWQTSSSAEQIFKAAGQEAKQRLETLFQKERGIRVIGEPVVTLVTGVT